MRKYELMNPMTLFHDLDRSFGHFFNQNENFGIQKLNPIANVREEQNFFDLTLDVPGIKKEDLKVELKENVLHISGERKSRYKDESGEYESMGSFERSFSLPQSIDLEQIEVSHNHGVLEVLLPKAQPKETSKVLNIKDQHTLNG